MANRIEDNKDNVLTLNFDTPSVRDDDEIDEKKYSLFEEWLKLGTVCVLFDARQEGVKVPEPLRKYGDLRLKFCYQFHVADFSFNQSAVWATLSFDQGEFFCSVPWEAVYGLQSEVLGEEAIWIESLPPDMELSESMGCGDENCHEEHEPPRAIEHEFDEQKCKIISFNSAIKNDAI